MKVQENKVLNALALQSKQNPKKLSFKIYQALQQCNLLDEIGNYWGYLVKESLIDNPRFETFFWLTSIQPTKHNVKLVKHLTIMLGDDCPCCGGEMVVDDDKTEYKHTSGDGFNDPMEYEPIYEVQRCKNCNYLEN